MLTDVLRNIQIAPWWVFAGMMVGFAMMATASLWGDPIEAWCVRHRVQRLVARLVWLPPMAFLLALLVTHC